MSTVDRFDSDLGGALADLARPQYPDYFDTVLERAMVANQRPAWTFPERWLPMGVIAQKSVFIPSWPWRRVGLVVALLALVLAATLILVGSGRRVAPPFGLAANGNVIYVVDGDIYVRPIDGTVGRLLVGGPELDVSPIYSRDGTKFAIIRLHEDRPNNALVSLMVANADGSGLHTVAGPERELGWWEWSPDSSEIAIVSQDRAVPALSIVNVNGDPARRAIDVPFQRDSIVFWRPPAGRELVIVDRSGSTSTVQTVRTDGSGLRTVSKGSMHWTFSLTPDGRQMVYHTDPASGSLALYAADLDTGDARRLGTNLPALANPGTGAIHTADGRITPDGRRVVFARIWDERDGEINRQLWVMDLQGDGSDAIPVSEVVRSSAGEDPFFELISPDGTTLLYRNQVSGKATTVDLSDGSISSLDWITSELTDWQRLAR